MSVADALYEQGNARYQAGDYTAAEALFRQLVEVVPQKDAKAHGRASYSLALTLIGQARPAEAKEALRAAVQVDPSLQRAKDQLAKLEQAFPPQPRPAERSVSPGASGSDPNHIPCSASSVILPSASGSKRSAMGGRWRERSR